MQKPHIAFLSDAQLKEEFNRCENCAEKPCREACPADCSPADFIMAARVGLPCGLQARSHAHHGPQPPGRHLRRRVSGLPLHEGLLPPHLRPAGQHPGGPGHHHPEGQGPGRDALPEPAQAQRPEGGRGGRRSRRSGRGGHAGPEGLRRRGLRAGQQAGRHVQPDPGPPAGQAGAALRHRVAPGPDRREDPPLQPRGEARGAAAEGLRGRGGRHGPGRALPAGHPGRGQGRGLDRLPEPAPATSRASAWPSSAAAPWPWTARRRPGQHGADRGDVLPGDPARDAPDRDRAGRAAGPGHRRHRPHQVHRDPGRRQAA